MDYIVKLTKCQNEHHHGGVFDMWTKWAKPQARLGTWLTRLYVGSQGRIRGWKAVEAERSDRSATWMVGRPSICFKMTLPSQ
jgi:hypothetical protein